MKLKFSVVFISFIYLNVFSQEKTNVVMIVLDDLNDYVGVMGGHPQSKTPNIDALANSGILFDNAHSNVPVCSPSRASFMTGILPTNSKNWGFGNWLKNEIQMNSSSIPEYFKANGYKTYKTGKVFHADKKGVWDVLGAVADYGPMPYNGKKTALHPNCPAAMGDLGPLDATFTSLKDIPVIKATDSTPGYTGWYSTHWSNKGPFHYKNDNERDLMTDEKSVKWFKDQLIEIEASKDKQPFLMALGIIRPHTPLVVPQKYYDMFPIEEVQVPILLKDDKDDTYLGLGSKKEPRGRKAFRTLTESYSSKELALRTYTQAYLASVAFADDMVGRAIAALNQSSFKDNTMVVLFSDHGYNMGEKDYLFKYCLWEETTKVPLIIRHPSYVKNAGARVNHPVSLVDIYPTLNDLCGLKGPTKINEKGRNIDGHSLKPFLENPKTKNWTGPSVALTVVASWKSQNPIRQNLSVRSENYRYILYENGSEELYDHRIDKNEWRNVASVSKYNKVKQKLRKELNQFFDK